MGGFEILLGPAVAFDCGGGEGDTLRDSGSGEMGGAGAISGDLSRSMPNLLIWSNISLSAGVTSNTQSGRGFVLAPAMIGPNRLDRVCLGRPEMESTEEASLASLVAVDLDLI